MSTRLRFPAPVEILCDEHFEKRWVIIQNLTVQPMEYSHDCAKCASWTSIGVLADLSGNEIQG